MEKPQNPVALADDSGLAYTVKEDKPAYILVNLKRDKEDENGKLEVNLSTEGINREQSIAILSAVIEAMRADIEVLSLTSEDFPEQ